MLNPQEKLPLDKAIRPILEHLEPRLFLAAQTIDISGVQPIALDIPTIHGILKTQGGDLLLGDDADGNLDYYDIQGYLDTGTSGVLIDSDFATAAGITQTTSNGQVVTYNDSGVAGSEGFGVSDPLNISLASSTAANDTRGSIFGFGNSPPDLSEYTQTFNNVRTQISRDAIDPFVGAIDIFGMPTLQGKVAVIDPTPTNNGSTISTFVYDPGTPFNSSTTDTDPGIPTTNLHVKLTYASFLPFTTTTPAGAPDPAEDANPFIGPDPLAVLSPKHPFDNTPAITMTMGSNSASGSFLFDTGGQASFISQAKAGDLGVFYAPGTYNTDSPELVDANGDPIPDQFQIPISGIGGTVNAAGFYMDSLTVPTMEGPGIRFLDAPVLVTDVAVTNPTTHQSLILDGDFGMNFTAASTDADEVSTQETPFDWETFDQTTGILGLDDPNVSVIPWPTASVSSAADLTTAGASTCTFTLSYAATTGQTVNAATIDNSDVLVTGPHGFSQLATEISVNQPGDGSAQTVTYRINAPAGTFSTANDGDYTITMQPNQVTDSAGDSVVSHPLAQFSIAIAPSSIPSTSAADTYYVQVDPASVYSEVFVNSPPTDDPTYLFSPTGMSTMAFNTAGGNDSVTIDFSVGNPLPAGGLSFDGGSGINTLSVIGSNGTDSSTIDGSQLTFGDIPLLYTNAQSILVNGGAGNATLEQLAQPSAALAFGGTGQDTLIVDAGSFTFNAIPTLSTATTSVFDFSSVIFSAAPASSGVTAQTFAALNIGPAATASMADAASHTDRSVLVLGSLVESSTSKLNLAGNDMIVHNGNLATINRALKNGFNAAAHGYWNGTGIDSSTAASDTRFLTALGARTADGTAFDGVGAASTDVLVKYTYYGDADLNGIVNGADYQQIDLGFGLHLTGWVNGDFNYDNSINGTDFALIDNTFNQTTAIAAAPLALTNQSPTITPAAATPPLTKIKATIAAPPPIPSTIFANPGAPLQPTVADLLDIWTKKHRMPNPPIIYGN